MVGEIIIKTKLALEDFEKGLEKMVDKAKEKGQKAGEVLSKAFNKAVNIGKGLLGVVGKIGLRFGKLLFSAGTLATILGGSVVGALSLAGAIKKVFENNEQLKANIQYLVFALTKAIEPITNKIAQVIEKIINLLFRAIQYTAYLIHAWTGKNIFENASMEAYAEYMEEANKSSKGTAKNMKEVAKQTEKFDEMNILQDNKSTGTEGIGGVSSAMPSFDLSNLENVEAPGWLKWIEKKGPEMVPMLLDIGTALGGIAVALGLIKLGLDPIMSMGIGIFVAGLAKTVLELLGYLKDPTWEHFGGIIKGMGLMVLGLGIVFGNLPAIIVGALMIIYGAIVTYWDKIEAFIDTRLIILKSKVDEWKEKFGETIGLIFEDIVLTLSDIWEAIDRFVKGNKKVFDGIIQFIKGVFAGDWKEAWEGIKLAFEGFTEELSGIWDLFIGNLHKKAVRIGGIIASATMDSIKSGVNAVLWYIENKINSTIDLINGVTRIANKLSGGNIGRINYVYLPRLAKGGIVNMPGSGVMVGSAVAGERGKEGVIPLTDSQQMELLGEAIGKYITVNNVNPIYLNGRQIAREINIANKESDFAFNR